jgi:8-amino-7-oxononanoate synthase
LDWIREEIDDLAAKGLIRHPPVLDPEPPDGRSIVVEGTRYVSFGSNNYLGLAGDARVRQAAARAAERYGAGSGASRLVVGTLAVHRHLERAIAGFKRTEDAVLFPTGYQAGIGAIAALAGPGDCVILDKLCHACLVDGARASRARVRAYPHLDVARLARLLDRERGARRLVVTDSLFSMDGDLAPLEAIMAAADRFDAMVLVDEAHATGTVGPGGRGLAAALGIDSPRLVQMGTLSKALGSVGGFIAGTRVLCDYLRNSARSYVYTTAPAPPAAGAALEALRILETEPALVDRLRENVDRLTARLPGLRASSPIVPVVVGEADRAIEAQAGLRERGMWVPAIRPPTVPRGTSRLRVSLSAVHTEDDLALLADSIRDLGLAGASRGQEDGP